MLRAISSRRWLLPTANSKLILLAWAVGIFQDESYWREVGQGPHAFSLFDWPAKILNGPAWVTARWAAISLVRSDSDLQFHFEHATWAALAFLQWRLYFAFANMTECHPRLGAAVRLVGALLAIVGVAASVHALVTFQEGDFWSDRFYWPVLYLSGAFIGLVPTITSHLATRPPSRIPT
jgi:hypothetical protein